MKIVKAENYADMSRKAAVCIAAYIICNSKCVLGLATGSTPEGIYEELVRYFERGVVDFSDVTTFNLDEYCGLSREHPQSYCRYMMEKLFNRVNIKRENVNLLDGVAKDMEAECRRYEEGIRQAGGIGLQLLGIGKNGHIGFNEPGDHFTRETGLVNLREDTIRANARFFKSFDQVPGQALSMGINTIMQAESILLVASGKDKSDALDKMINGPVSPGVPASVLQLHRHVTVIYC